jgi:hypothetical protein
MSTHPMLHPHLASTYAKQRQAELQKEAAGFRAAAGVSTPNRVERFFIKRREGKVTWIDTVLVQRSA